jgi:hypothetical protein
VPHFSQKQNLRMKARFTLLAALFVAFFSAQAQTIPNAGFETWTSPLNPDNWSTYSSAFGFNLGLCAKDSLDKVVGNNSVRVYADSIPGQPAYGVIAGVVATGTASAGAQGPKFSGIPFAYHADTLFFAYKYTSPGNDTANVVISMTKNGSGVFVNGYSALSVSLDTTSQWGLVYIPLSTAYANATITPDTLLLIFQSANRQQTKGSTLHVDQVFFSQSQTTGIEDLNVTYNVSIFPNPVSSELKVQADVVGGQIVITDLNGKLVRIRPLEGPVTSVDMSDVASGTYIYRIADKNNRFVKQDKFNVVK